MPQPPGPTGPREVTALVVGSGFGGIAMAARLRRMGVDDFVIVERGADVGGTWRDNTYPGAACDVPSHLYSFSFAPNPDWTSAFSPQAEIHSYLQTVARSVGAYDKCRFGAELTSARWDDAAQRWTASTTGGDFRARFLISAAGPLSDPASPALPGIEAFAGTTFHSARWDHTHVLSGERVAVIGNRGLGRPARSTDRTTRRAALDVPAHPTVGHPASRPGVRPVGAVGLPARARGAKVGSGRRLLGPVARGDVRVARLHRRRFPNLFLVIGPNTGLGHTSMVVMIEANVAYIADAIRQILARGLSSVQPRDSAMTAYNVARQRQLAPSVWNAGGCRSWYLDARGHNTTLWPDFTFRFRRQTRRCDLTEYETVRASKQR